MRQSGTALQTNQYVALVTTLFIAGLAGLATSWLGSLPVIMSIALAIIGLIALKARNAELALLLLISSFPFSSWFLLEASGRSGLLMAGGLVALTWLLRVGVTHSPLRLNLWPSLCAAFLAVWATVATISNSGIKAISQADRYWFVIILFFLCQLLLDNRRALLRFSRIMVLSRAFLGTVVLAERLSALVISGWELDARQLHLFPLSVGDPNRSGVEIVTALPFAWYLLFGEVRKHMRLVWGVCIILILAGTFATVSFTAFLSLAVSMFFTARWQMRGRYTRTIFIIVLIGVLIVGMFSPLGARFREEVLYSMRTREPFYWFSSRVLAWYVGFQVAMQRPLLGTGPVPIGVYESIAAGFLPADLVAARLARGLPLLMVPHNLYLSFATETGLPGLLAFLGLLVFTVLPLWLQVRSERAHLPGSREPTIEAALLVGLIIALFSGLLLSEHLNYKALWVLLGITSSVIRRTAERGLSVPKSIWYRR